jgi:hypothetical protein
MTSHWLFSRETRARRTPGRRTRLVVAVVVEVAEVTSQPRPDPSAGRSHFSQKSSVSTLEADSAPRRAAPKVCGRTRPGRRQRQ